ncbi:hypothetical protein DdX_16751 [Ditylenchus destructor]|uniref:Uncharacterized protein n=1 Tax=Ditylenchus destructor TaxID=166010 RepID=A0AAD4MNG3_9BILA|nr:hypothetical protein DdX_16751 [Ditylenchus destructor]
MGRKRQATQPNSTPFNFTIVHLICFLFACWSKGTSNCPRSRQEKGLSKKMGLGSERGAERNGRVKRALQMDSTHYEDELEKGKYCR